MEQVASTEQVAQTTASTPEVKVETKPEVTTPQTLTEEKVKQLIADANAKALEEGRKLGLREMQAIKDREVAAEKRRAEEALKRAKIYEGDFADLDEDSRAKIEARRLRAEVELYKQKETEESLSKRQEMYVQRMEQSLKDEITAMGIDPSDKRIDFAKDAVDYFEGRKRFTESLAKIIKDDRLNLEKSLKTEAENKFKSMEQEFRKKYGLDSHDTSNVTGVVNQSDADFLKAWGNYELPNTKENRLRYEAIKKKY